jgi:cysteinyl-tRNA synthetase
MDVSKHPGSVSALSFAVSIPNQETVHEMKIKAQIWAVCLAACVLAGGLASCQDTETTGEPKRATLVPQPPAGSVELPGLAEVRHWLYLIDVDLEADVVAQIAASAYDMIVLDYIPSERESADYPMAEVVVQLHNARQPKLVLAYVDIGEAEDYRTYWQPGWEVGDPAWIAGDDPDGWQGNYPVAYWDEGWRAVWLGDGSLLDQIVGAGFDGVYLDWVEAYSDENVLVLAERDGVDAVAEMIRWVGEIAAFGRARRSGFLVVAQNAAELAEREEYLALIDAIAQEQVWFDGMADGQRPEGDCPLPRTDDDIDSDAYYDALSRDCQFYFDEVPGSALYVSSAEYLHYLEEAHARGEIIFAVDYALEADNVAYAYRESRARGFVPFAANRALDRYLPPMP